MVKAESGINSSPKDVFRKYTSFSWKDWRHCSPILPHIIRSGLPHEAKHILTKRGIYRLRSGIKSTGLLEGSLLILKSLVYLSDYLRRYSTKGQTFHTATGCYRLWSGEYNQIMSLSPTHSSSKACLILPCPILSLARCTA